MKAERKDRRGGFTLIELLLVISIILLLVSILAVAVTPPQGAVVAQKRMDSLDAALSAYRSVYGYYPPSSYSNGMFGAQKLYYYLKGPTGTGWSPPTVMAEYTWEGAMNVSGDWVTTPTNYSGKAYFNDGIQGGDRAILYYRAAWRVGDVPTGQLLASTTNSVGLDNYFNYNDNCEQGALYTSDSPFWPGTGNSPSTTAIPAGVSKKQQWYNEITDWSKTRASVANNPDLANATSNAATRYPQRPMSYIMISAGKDREFGLPSDPSRGWASDDITNFSP